MTQFAKETLPISLEEEMRRSYLDYAMSVIVGRALPDARDGLKPVHRRVLFAMHEQNNDWNRPFKKSARIVGDTMGKYHPHGDTAIYDTIVRMAQPFSLRHMLVDGQGNFGSVDGDNAAAMRYTEIRLAKIAHEMLADLDKETVDFGPNYDGNEREPLVLPSKLPNLLVNGSAGIAVGMATNIPPHNLNEIVDACLHLLQDPRRRRRADGDRAGSRLPDGRNHPRPCPACARATAPAAAASSCAPRPLRGHRDGLAAGDHRRRDPYQVNKKHLLSDGRARAREEARGHQPHPGRERQVGMRVVIELKRGEVPEVVLNNLYKQTQLQDTFGINMVALVDGQPKLCNLKELSRSSSTTAARW
jgi:DNA gyrase subunit A